MFTSIEQLRLARHYLGNLPLTVISHGNKDSLGLSEVSSDQLAAIEMIWLKLQQDLSRLSTQGELVVVDDTGHFVHQDNPDAVIEQITKVTQQSR